MSIKTKFELDQYVYIIRLATKSETNVCKLCNGKGVVNVEGSKLKAECPECWGNGEIRETKPEEWRIVAEGKIGRINVELYSSEYKKEYKDSIKYMIDTTGVGCGSLYNEEDIYPTHNSAIITCAKFNREMKKEK